VPSFTILHVVRDGSFANIVRAARSRFAGFCESDFTLAQIVLHGDPYPDLD
jgi:hypothetical protein